MFFFLIYYIILHHFSFIYESLANILAASSIIKALFQIENIPKFRKNRARRRMYEKQRAKKAVLYLILVAVLSFGINAPRSFYELVISTSMLSTVEIFSEVLKYFSFSLLTYISNVRFWTSPIIKWFSKFYRMLDENGGIIMNKRNYKKRVKALFCVRKYTKSVFLLKVLLQFLIFNFLFQFSGVFLYTLD